MPRLPEFLIIGATKAGTTSLYRYLSQHPELFFAPIKEPNFLAFHESPPEYRGPQGSAPITRTSITTFDEYVSLFDGAAGRQLVGEASPLYLYHPAAVSGIRRFVPDAKLIAILRDPAERAWSSYQHLLREGLEPLGFEEALDAEKCRIDQNWGILWRYVDVGRYGEQVDRYRGEFDDEQLLFLDFDDLVTDPAAVCRSVFRFLGVADDVPLRGLIAHNATGEPKSRLLYRMLNPAVTFDSWVRSHFPEGVIGKLRGVRAKLTRKLLVREQLPERARRRVATELTKEVCATSRLTGLRVDEWLP